MPRSRSIGDNWQNSFEPISNGGFLLPNPTGPQSFIDLWSDLVAQLVRAGREPDELDQVFWQMKVAIERGPTGLAQLMDPLRFNLERLVARFRESRDFVPVRIAVHAKVTTYGNFSALWEPDPHSVLDPEGSDFRLFDQYAPIMERSKNELVFVRGVTWLEGGRHRDLDTDALCHFGVLLLEALWRQTITFLTAHWDVEVRTDFGVACNDEGLIVGFRLDDADVVRAEEEAEWLKGLRHSIGFSVQRFLERASDPSVRPRGHIHRDALSRCVRTATNGLTPAVAETTLVRTLWIARRWADRFLEIAGRRALHLARDLAPAAARKIDALDDAQRSRALRYRPRLIMTA